MLPMALGKNSLQVLREAILRLSKSIHSNRTFHGSRVEAVLCGIEGVVHPGRDLGATSVTRDTQNFFRFCVQHMSAAIDLERNSDPKADLVTKGSVARLIHGSPGLRCPYSS